MYIHILDIYVYICIYVYAYIEAVLIQHTALLRTHGSFDTCENTELCVGRTHGSFENTWLF